jgi:hypothetical protein
MRLICLLILFTFLHVGSSSSAKEKVSKEDKNWDRAIFKKFYKPTFYPIDKNLVILGDTIFSDSIRLLVDEDSKKYDAVFKRGIISCSLIYDFHGPNSENLPHTMFDKKTGKEFRDSIIWFMVYDVQELKYLKAPKHCKRFKFKVAPYWYLFELRNDKCGRKAHMENFLKNATLTWFRFSGKMEI